MDGKMKEIIENLNVLEEKIMEILDTEDDAVDYEATTGVLVSLMEENDDVRFYKFIIRRLAEMKLIKLDGLKGVNHEFLNYDETDERFSVIDEVLETEKAMTDETDETDGTLPLEQTDENETIEEQVSERRGRGRPKKLYGDSDENIQAQSNS